MDMSCVKDGVQDSYSVGSHGGDYVVPDHC